MTNTNVAPEPEVTLSTKKNRQSLLLLLAVFALPIILAKLALEQQWLDFGVTNQGTLLENELTLTDLGIDNSGLEQQWLIIYRLPEQCSKDCQKTLEVVHNSYVALGKEMPRITPVVLQAGPFSSEQSQRIKKSQWHVMPLPNLAAQQINQEKILLADPLGNIILSYDPVTEQSTTSSSTNEKLSNSAQQQQLSKAIIADMKKLLKYSKVG